MTIDIFCGTGKTFELVRKQLDQQIIADLCSTEPQAVRWFEIPNLHVIKFSLPREHIQVSPKDQGMNGAQFAELLRKWTIKSD